MNINPNPHAKAPSLPQGCNSWIVVCPQGNAMLETTSAKDADQFAKEGYRVVTAMDWLSNLNKGGSKA